MLDNWVRNIACPATPRVKGDCPGGARGGCGVSGCVHQVEDHCPLPVQESLGHGGACLALSPAWGLLAWVQAGWHGAMGKCCGTQSSSESLAMMTSSFGSNIRSLSSKECPAGIS